MRKRNLRSEELPPPILALLTDISEVYSNDDSHRELIQRSLELSSQDLNSRNQELLTQQMLAKAARENAQESEQRLRLAIEGTGMGSFTWDVARGSMDCAMRALEICGLPAGKSYTLDDILGLIHPDDKEGLAGGLKDALEKCGRYVGRCRLVRPEGDVRWLEILGRGVDQGNSGRIGVASAFYGFLRDVTSEESAHALKETLAMLVQSSDAGVVSATLAGEIVNWNNGATLLYGRSADQAAGTNLLSLVEPDKRAEFEKAMENIAAGIAAAPIETRFIQPSGHEISLLLNVSPLRHSDATVYGAAVIMQDITDMKRVRIAEQERDALLNAMKKLEGALAVVAHELRTPLGGIRATLEILVERLASDKANERFLKSALDAVVQTSRVVNDMLEALRINSGCAHWTWSEFDLSNAVEVAVDCFGSDPLSPEVTFKWNITPPDIRMWGDQEAISRLILNLLSNARKNTTSGEIALHVECTDHSRPRCVQIEVSDTGCGMGSEILSSLGEPFVLNSGLIGRNFTQGAGVGLAICKGIVAAHGGNMRIDSSPDAGTSVSITLQPDLPVPAKCDRLLLQTSSRRTQCLPV